MKCTLFFPLLKPTLLKPVHPQSPIVLAALKTDFSGLYFLRKDTGNEFLIVKTWVLLGLFKRKKRRSLLFIFLVEN